MFRRVLAAQAATLLLLATALDASAGDIALREDVEIALEVRIVRVEESFLERLGIVCQTLPAGPSADQSGPQLKHRFLSDIEMFMFMEACQGDKRTTLMQAPKLTLANGEIRTIQLQEFQWTVSNVQVIQGPRSQSMTEPGPFGLNLAVQAVMADDQKSIGLKLAPTMVVAGSSAVPLFPITTFVTLVVEGGCAGQPFPYTQFLQQPTLTTFAAQTSVSVSIDKTVMITGLKHSLPCQYVVSREFPFLGKLPHLHRLFNKVACGQDTYDLVMLVTPRIVQRAQESGLAPNGGVCTPDATECATRGDPEMK